MRTQVATLERRCAKNAATITAQINHAWGTYRWLPLPAQTQSAAWTRLRSYAAHLRGITREFDQLLNQADATASLLQWLQIIKLSPDDAIAWLLNPEAEPDWLLEQLASAAVADATAQTTEMVLRLAYDMQPTAERIEHVRQLRLTYPIVSSSLPPLPSWALSDELLALHALCAQEEASTHVQQVAADRR